MIMIKEARLKIRLIDNNMKAIKRENPYWRAFYASGFGIPRDDYLDLHPVEVLYLLDQNRAVVLEDSRILSLEELLERYSDELTKYDLWTFFIVYKDIRSRGYLAKMRNSNLLPIEIYPRGSSPLESRPFAFIAIAEASKAFNLNDLVRAFEEAKNEGVKMIIALVDELGDIAYYSVDETLIEETTLKIFKR